ncbi:MAG: tetratricopeptide repeat protein [Clostridia bacterium]|nr:tetratricopeptide repeat protein [Clostridia bacterium]
MRYDIGDIKRMERESNRLIGEMRFAEAEAMLREALQVTSTPPVLNNLAFCRFYQNDSEEALEILQPNLSTGVHNPFAHALAAQICVALGRRDEAEKHLESAIRDFEDGLPKARLAPAAIAKPWRQYSVALKRAAGDLGRHQLVIDLYRRHETYHAGVEDRFLAGVAEFNLDRIGRAISYWKKVPWQFAADYVYVAQAVDMGVVPRFSLEYRLPDLGGTYPQMAAKGAGRMMIVHSLLAGETIGGDTRAASAMLSLAVDVDREWGLQLAKNIIEYPAASSAVKTAALGILVDCGVCQKGQLIDAVDENGRETRVSVQEKIITFDTDEQDKEAILKAAELGDADRFDEAIEVLCEATDAHEVSFRVYLALATTYMYKGDLDRAHDLLSMLRDIAPDHPMLLFRLAEYYTKSGRVDEAIRCLDRIDLETMSPTFRKGIADLREALGRASN